MLEASENDIEVKLRDCVLGVIRVSRRKPKVPILVTLRISSIQKLIQGRHGGPCDTDDGELYFVAVAPYLAQKGHALGNSEFLASWCTVWLPLLPSKRITELVKEGACEGKFTADKMAQLLRVTAEEVNRFKLRTLGAIDRPKCDRKTARRDADRKYQLHRRLAQGATPRSRSLTARKPWEQESISRATYYRRRLKSNHEGSGAVETESSALV